MGRVQWTTCTQSEAWCTVTERAHPNVDTPVADFVFSRSFAPRGRSTRRAVLREAVGETMFIIVDMRDTVRIPPHAFNSELLALSAALDEKYSNKARA